ncbi:MAG: two-component system response regulator [Candidatus Schekmanbacteria bacterium RBG_13_48_7]|uniref:Two-component system response regulator n=1 Tax=Candidatus Schekmanbacteria bacterium RBG_13_48_7 TaxID=1817878 RepID=A0A1F7RL25_9BACT|nr:MAG: two-component system response regulator [Candidatus Schekmanbacteria bacterium RBG_13_48_7]
MPGEKVLLVDDEEEFTSVLSERMESRGLNVDIADSGISALDKVHEHPYDVIILDLAMPGMDGIETLKRIRELNPDLQVILLTGHATLEKGVEAVKLGAMDFLEKPADIQQLMQKIKDAKANRMLLVQKKTEEKIKNILRTKGW